MEDWLFYSLTTLLCLLCSLLLGARAKSDDSPSPSPPLPPGPAALPVLGPLLHLTRRDFDLEPLLRRLARAYGPVFSFAPLGPSRPTIFIAARGAAFASRPPAAAAATVLTSGGRSVSSAPYGLTWRALRRTLAAGVLNPARLRAFAPARRWVLRVLLSRLRSADGSGSVVAVMEPFQYAMFCLLVHMCFGGGGGVIGDIEAMQRDLLGNFLTFQVFAFLPPLTKLVFRRRWSKLVSLRRRQEELFVPLIRARREYAAARGAAGDCDCYVDSLVRLVIPEDGGRGLTDGEIVSLCSEFLSAGTDTTATALQWILANLVKHPTMQDRLRAEVSAAVGDGDGEVREEDLQQGMPYLKAVVLEELRWHPPGHYVLPHAAAEETTLDGYRVPVGAPVNFSVGDIGRRHRAGRGGVGEAGGVPAGSVHARRRRGGR